MEKDLLGIALVAVGPDDQYYPEAGHMNFDMAHGIAYCRAEDADSLKGMFKKYAAEPAND